jgi:hypothetical protein
MGHASDLLCTLGHPDGGSLAVSTNGGGSDGQAGTKKLLPSIGGSELGQAAGQIETLGVGGCELDGHAGRRRLRRVPAESTEQVGPDGSQQVVAGEVTGSLSSRSMTSRPTAGPSATATATTRLRATTGVGSIRLNCPNR